MEAVAVDTYYIDPSIYADAEVLVIQEVMTALGWMRVYDKALSDVDVVFDAPDAFGLETRQKGLTTKAYVSYVYGGKQAKSLKTLAQQLAAHKIYCYAGSKMDKVKLTRFLTEKVLPLL